MNRSLLTLLSTSLLALSVGCGVGTIDGGPVAGGDGDGDGDGDTGDANARKDFDALVAPIMEANCADAACHTGTGTAAPKFLGPSSDPSTWYDEIIQYSTVIGDFDPTKAGILTKIAPGDHNGVTYTSQEVDDITTWLTNEAAARDGGGGDPTPANLLATWSGCMTQANWDQAGMGSWALKTAEGGTVCSSCHDQGMENFDTNPDSAEMFRRNRLEPFVTGFFVQVGNEIQPAYDKITLKSTGNNNHPTFLVDDEYYDSLESFYQLTKGLFDQGNCPESGFPAPAP